MFHRQKAFFRAWNKTQQYSSFFKHNAKNNLSSAVKKTSPKHTRACRSKAITKRRWWARQIVFQEVLICNRVAGHERQTIIYDIMPFHSKCRIVHRSVWVICFTVNDIVVCVYRERLKETTFLKISFKR